MSSPDTNALLSEVSCYACYTANLAELLDLAFLRRKLLTLNPAADVSAQSLLDYAKCFGCNTGSSFDMLELALLDQISQTVSN